MSEIETPMHYLSSWVLFYLMFAETPMKANFQLEILEILTPQKKCLKFSLMRHRNDWVYLQLFYLSKMEQKQLYPPRGPKNTFIKKSQKQRNLIYGPSKKLFLRFSLGVPIFYFACPLLGPKILFTKTKKTKLCNPIFEPFKIYYF